VNKLRTKEKIMQTVQLNLDKEQFINIIRLMDDVDKLEIYTELKKNILSNRFESLLQSLKTDDLSLEEITQEVENVRQQRYESGKQIL
jgi:hypothetical protein